jgi:hypothetical protein
LVGIEYLLAVNGIRQLKSSQEEKASRELGADTRFKDAGCAAQMAVLQQHDVLIGLGRV